MDAMDGTDGRAGRDGRDGRTGWTDGPDWTDGTDGWDERTHAYCSQCTLRRLIIVQGGLITSTGVVLVVLLLVFVIPGAVLVAMPLRLLRLKNRPRDYKNQYQDHQDHPRTTKQPI